MVGATQLTRQLAQETLLDEGLRVVREYTGAGNGGPTSANNGYPNSANNNGHVKSNGVKSESNKDSQHERELRLSNGSMNGSNGQPGLDGAADTDGMDLRMSPLTKSPLSSMMRVAVE